jgi:hypothetical protein
MSASPIDAMESIAPWSTKISSAQAGAQVSSVDAEAFSRLLSGPKPEASPDASQSIGAITPTSNTLGDSILRSLQSMGGEFTNAWGNIVKATGPADGPMSMTDALNVQWHMVTVSAQYEAIGKAIGKSAQDIDQLVRTQ